MKNRYRRGSDGWGRNSFMIPATAVVGSSDTGDAPDSPAHTDRVEEELKRFQRDLFAVTRIESERAVYTQGGNVYMLKRWVTVSESNFAHALEFAKGWLKEHDRDTRFIHDAEGEEVDWPLEPVQEPVVVIMQKKEAR